MDKPPVRAIRPDDPRAWDRRIARAIARGDHEAEEELFERYGRGLWLMVYQRSGDHELADDLSQQALLIALERLRKGSIMRPHRLAPFLAGTVKNLLRQHYKEKLRRGTVHGSDVLDRLADEGSSPGDETAKAQERDLLLQAIGELSRERDRQVLLRYYVWDQDRSAICNALSLDPLQLSRVLYRARARLIEAVRQLTETPPSP